MPYGIAKKLGGDTPEVDARMERCVEKVMGEGHGKIAAIAICKFSIQNKLRKGRKSAA